MIMPVEKFHVSMPLNIYAEVVRRGAARGERSAQIALSLDRYFSILRAERRKLKDRLSDAEIALICDALNGVWLGDQANIRLVWASVEDAIRLDNLDAKWGVDGTPLVAKLKTLDYATLVALVDAVEMWWQREDRRDPTVAEVLGS